MCVWIVRYTILPSRLCDMLYPWNRYNLTKPLFFSKVFICPQ